MERPRLNPDLYAVPGYVAGKSAEEVGELLGLEDLLKLNSNEAPLGPSPKALAAMAGAFSQTHRYPGLAERDLRRKLAETYGNGLDESCFVIGNGGTDLLRMMAQAYIFDHAEALMSAATFPLYNLVTLMFGGRAVRVPLLADYNQDLETMMRLASSQISVVWLCSPNNPTGLTLPHQLVSELLEAIPPQAVVIIDAAYSDYITDPQAVDPLVFIRAGRNVIAVHSFSKSAGLAGLRVGYAIAPPELCADLRRTILPFNTGGLALTAATASLDDLEYRQRSRRLVLSERAFLHRGLTDLGLHSLPSQANFVLLLDPPCGAAGLAKFLARQGIIIRTMETFGMPGTVRITVGRREENERFLKAVSQAVSQEQQGFIQEGLPAENLAPVGT